MALCDRICTLCCVVAVLIKRSAGYEWSTQRCCRHPFMLLTCAVTNAVGDISKKSYYNTQSQNTNRNPTHLICHFHLPRTISNDPADASITHCHRHCHRRWLQTLAPHLCQQVGWSMHAPLLATCTAMISRIRRHYGRNQPPVPPPQSLPQDWKEYFDESNHRLCEMPVTSGRRLMALVASD